ncbi:phospholipase D-like domain-containing protein [Roseibium sp.]|uniref:phospholipase D-like domain-containing protein n=1 Tax=Roseibium sp. TaxID=1936156 RepID=UPI003A97BCF0
MLISNTYGADHAGSIAELINGADTIIIAVAFLKKRGADYIAPILKKRLAAGATVELFVGTDFFLTEPAALQRMLELGKRNPRCCVMVAGRSSATFHTKIYSARRGKRWHSIIGSANLTHGALRSNEELSLRIDHGAGDALTGQLAQTFERYRNWERFQKLDMLVLQQYKSAYEIDRRERAKYEKARERALLKGLDLRVITEWHTRYLADPGTAAEQTLRRRNRVKALGLQKLIAALADKPIDAAAGKGLRQSLGDLMGSSGGQHLWGSGSIPRQGSKALEHPRKMIELFALAHEASRRSPHKGYAEMKSAADTIPGVGINMATEILCTFAPTRYAVYNGNTAGALSILGISVAPHAKFRAIGPDRYEQVCDTIKALGARIGAADLSEADAFLNWIYWKAKTGEA